MLRTDEFADQICKTLPGSDKIKLVSERDRQQFEAGWRARGEADASASCSKCEAGRKPSQCPGLDGWWHENIGCHATGIHEQTTPPAAQPASEPAKEKP